MPSKAHMSKCPVLIVFALSHWRRVAIEYAWQAHVSSLVEKSHVVFGGAKHLPPVSRTDTLVSQPSIEFLLDFHTISPHGDAQTCIAPIRASDSLCPR